MIEDKTLRDLFRSESDEHLQRLDDDILRMEQEGRADQAMVEEMFRAAHSLKGAARMLGLSDVEAVAHGFEETLAQGRSDGLTLDAESAGRLLKALKALRRLAEQAVSGTPAGVDVTETLAGLKGTVPARSAFNSADEPVRKPAETAAATATAACEKPAEQVPAQAPPASISRTASPSPAEPQFRIDTVRVETSRLDVLLNQAGELTVARGRVARRIGELDEIMAFVDEWMREDLFKRHRQIVTGRRAVGERRYADHRLDALREHLLRLRTHMYEDNSRLGLMADSLVGEIRDIRLLPLSTLFGLFPRVAHELSRERNKRVELMLEGGEVSADKRILEDMKDPLMHLLRNAIDHGIEAPDERRRLGKPELGRVRLAAQQTATNILVEVSDDGRGLDMAAIRRAAVLRKFATEAELAAMTQDQIQTLIFASGLSTQEFVTDVSGRGIGMDVVRTNVERLKGTIRLESRPGQGLTVRMQLPITLATTRVLIIRAQNRLYALPTEHIQTSCLIGRDQFFTIEGREAMKLGAQVMPVYTLLELLGISRIVDSGSRRAAPVAKRVPCIVLQAGDQQIGVAVDELVEEQEVVLRAQSGILRRVRNVSGAAILETGEVCPVLNAADLIKTAHKARAGVVELPKRTEVAKKAILLAEDSITTRTQEKRILEDAGYEVITAVDGLDAFNKLGLRNFDALVTDINMPNLDGLALTRKVRQDAHYREMPIILVTALSSDEDKRRGLEAGANAYISKPSFDQKILLDCLARFV